jgi:hypothetical protein
VRVGDKTGVPARLVFVPYKKKKRLGLTIYGQIVLKKKIGLAPLEHHQKISQIVF